jgi:hypothetical protein
MNLQIPLSLPPPLRLPPANQNLGHPLLGERIAYEDLLPGEDYIIRFQIQGRFGRTNPPSYMEIKLLTKTDIDFTFEESPQVLYQENERGDPLTPYLIPEAPTIVRRNRIHTYPYNPASQRFYKVSPVKRGRYSVGPQIKEKLKTNLRRKQLNSVLNKFGLSTNVGTGPANTIRQMVGLQPPKGAKGIPLRTRKEGGKRKARKTRKTRK